MRGHCRKNCNFDYLNRLAFRIFLQRLNLKHKSFVLVHNLHDEIFFPVIQYLIVELCTCYTEPHLSMTCPRTSQNTKQYHSWTKNREKLWMIFDLLALRPISHITQKTLSFLHSKRIEQITKTMVLVLKQAPLFFAAFAAANTTTNFRPAARAYSQRYHLLFLLTPSIQVSLGSFTLQLGAQRTIIICPNKCDTVNWSAFYEYPKYSDLSWGRIRILLP